jgi:rubrerythrin
MPETQDFFSAAAAIAGAEELDVPTMELLFRLECSGEDFYFALADRIGDDRAADLLRKNGREEVGHARRIQRAISLKTGQDYEPSAEVLERYAIPLPDEIDAAILPVIVQAELDGDAGYQRWADRESNPEVAKLLRQNGVEETKHGERVTEAIAILAANGS